MSDLKFYVKEMLCFLPAAMMVSDNGKKQTNKQPDHKCCLLSFLGLTAF